MKQFMGYVKVKQGDYYISSPTHFKDTKRELVMRLKVWLFDNSYDNETPFVIMVKPEEGGTYECIVDNNGAAEELFSII